MSVTELKERHTAATHTVNSLRQQLNQKRLLLLDTDVAGYSKAQNKLPVTFTPTDLVCCRTLQGHSGKVYSLDWTPEKNRIVSASQDGRLIVWNALTSQKTHAIKLPCPWVMTCAFSPSGQSVACGGLDSICSIFNLNSSMDKDGNVPVSRMLSGHKGYVSSCQYVPDEDTHLITSSGDHTCILWDITTGLRTSVFGGEFQSGHTADVLSVSINGSNSRMFVSGSCDATARLWDTRVASRAVRTFYGHEGRLLFAGYANGDCYVWDTLLAQVVLNLGSLHNSHEGRISCLGLSADGSALCTGSWDSNLKIWAFGGHRKVT
ncbi:Heterotrimeric G protein beta 2 subunit [Heracleum sosnowskyi]|uniref:Heterotrimeric G protein beta 2 subunit n=1 Tax=Heracleum sosnowskyi TaxID=360622 RepID=A0AAD8H2T8_9APIA|nr:Heterotrimeric G protein beta 2 subunit [Heracleum sosnowskyi]